MKELEEEYRVKNSYSNYKEWISFSFEIHKCTNTTEITYEDDNAISKLIKELQFTMYTLTETSEINSKTNNGRKPTFLIDKFHS